MAGRHLEVFLLAPAAEVVPCRYLRCRPYRHVAVVFIGLLGSILHAVQHVGHVVAVDGECSSNRDVLGSHLIRQRAVPAVERIAFLRRPIPQRVDVLAVLVGVQRSMPLSVHEVLYRMLISRVVKLQHELAVSCYRSFRHVLLGLLVICEPCERRRVRRRQRIRLSEQFILRQAYRILPVQAFQIVLYLILRISVGRERSGYLHVLCRHLERFRPAPAAERIAFLHRLWLDAYLLAVPVALCAFICRPVHLVRHVVAVPRVVQPQRQASVSGYRTGLQRRLSGFRIVAEAFIHLRLFRYRRPGRSRLVPAFFQGECPVHVLLVVLYPVLRVVVRYRASGYLHVTGRHLEAFLLAPAAKVVACRYLRCRPYRHVTVVFVAFYISVLHAVQHVGHVIAVNRECSFDLQILRTHNFWKCPVPAAESVAFLHWLFPQRVDGLAVLVGVQPSILLSVHKVSYCMLFSCIEQLQYKRTVSCNRA